MANRSWTKHGPRIFGYEPGWLWWAAVLVLVVGGAYVLLDELTTQQRSRAYINERIAHHAAEQGLDVALVSAVVQAESGFDWQAESGKGAKGLMQVTPVALEDVRQRFKIGSGDLFNIDYNLRVGTLYLAYLIERFEGDVTLAVAAYHMGPTRVAMGLKKHPNLTPGEVVAKHGGPQTRAYVKKVLGLIGEAQ